MSGRSGRIATARGVAVARHANESSSLGYGLEELKFLRSFADARNLGAKFAYKLALRRSASSGRAPAVPPSIQIEPTNICNLRCTTCPGARSPYPRGFMDMGLFEKIISQASRVGVKRVHLYLRGEPLLHPGIFEMVALSKSKGLAVHLTTNGTKLTPERSAGLFASGVTSADQLTVSFLGHSKESHEATMVGVDHDLVVENIRELMRLRGRLRANGPVVEVILNAPPENQHESEDFLKFWRGKVDHARLGRISVEFQEYGRDAVNALKRTQPCNGTLERMPVFWDGKVPQCNGDFDGEWILGDLSTDLIADVWNCDRLREVRRLQREGRLDTLPGCLHCDM